MEFKYFILGGDALNIYLESEKKEMEQKQRRHKVLTEDKKDEIEGYREYRNRIISLIFHKGKQPAGMVRSSPRFCRTRNNDVMPHKKLKIAEEWRNLLKSIEITEDCNTVIQKYLGLKNNVIGSCQSSHTGLAMFFVRVGHMGPNVIVEVPYAESNEGNKSVVHAVHPDLKEIEKWEIIKMHSDFNDHKYENIYYLEPR